MAFEHLFEHEMDYPPVLPESKAPEASEGEQEDAPPVSDEKKHNDAIARLLPGGGGVYLLTDEKDRIIQLASAGDMRRALRNRLLEPPPAASEDQPVPAARRRLQLGRIVSKIRWQPAHSMFEITLTYYRIARELMPKDYLDNVAFGPAWFVHVDPEAEIPRFVASKRLAAPPGIDLGPFATQADANRFVDLLEDAFDLCRYYHILEQVPHGQPCAYFEMGRCPAPCNATVPMSNYREMIGSALAFALGERSDVFANWENQMQQASAALEFERAGAIRQRLERARSIDHAAFARAGDLRAFRYLIVQRGPGRTRVKPFFVRGGWIQAGETVRLKELEHSIPTWLAKMGQPAVLPPGSAISDDKVRRLLTEQIWLVSHFLFKRDPPGLFFRDRELEDPAGLAHRIHDRFAPAPRATQEVSDAAGSACDQEHPPSQEAGG